MSQIHALSGFGSIILKIIFGSWSLYNLSTWLMIGISSCLLINIIGHVLAYFFKPDGVDYEKIHGPCLGRDDEPTIYKNVIKAPLEEELIFRGPILLALAFQQLIQKPASEYYVIGEIDLFILSSFIFMAAHAGIRYKYADGFLNPISSHDLCWIGIMGVIFGLVAVYMNNIWPAIVVHAMWNGHCRLKSFLNDILIEGLV